MSLWASNCYRFASRGRRPPIRGASSSDASSSSSSKCGDVAGACRSQKKRASLAIACSGSYNATRGSSAEGLCHACWRCLREEARPASVTRFSDVQSQFDRACGAYARSLTFWTPPVHRRPHGESGADSFNSIASCGADVYDVVDDHARSRGSAGCDSSVVSVNRWDFVNHDAQQPIAITSQCEDLVTALELYRHHLFSVLLTPELCKTLHTDTEDRSRSVRFVERDASRHFYFHEPDQYRRLWQHPDKVVPLTSLRHLHSSARFNSSSGGGDAEDKSTDKKAVTKAPVTWAQRVRNVPGALKRAPGAIWRELVHLYHGFRLLAIDIKIASKLIRQILNGGNLSRREKNQVITPKCVITYSYSSLLIDADGHLIIVIY